MFDGTRSEMMSPFFAALRTSWLLIYAMILHPGLHLEPLEIPSVITDGSHGEFPRVCSPARCIWALLVA